MNVYATFCVSVHPLMENIFLKDETVLTVNVLREA